MSIDYAAAFFGIHVNTDKVGLGWSKMGEGDANIFKNISELIEHHMYKSPLDEENAKKIEAYLTWEYVGTFKNDNQLRELLEKFNFSTRNLADVDPDFSNEKNGDKHPKAAIYQDNRLLETTDLGIFKDLCEYEIETVYSSPERLEKEKEKYPNKTFIDFDAWVGGLRDSPEYISLYAKQINPRRGHYYDYKDFTDLKEKLKTKYDGQIRRLIKLENIKDSVDYFKLSNEEKDDFLCTIDDLKEEINDIEWGIEACSYFMSIIDFYEDIHEDDNTYYDPKHVIAYIWHD